MAQQHTPGPWVLDPFGRGMKSQYEVRRSLAPQAVVASIRYVAGIYADEREANARLIAQAPAMLEALREMVLLVDGAALGVRSVTDETARFFLAQARAVIAAATKE